MELFNLIVAIAVFIFAGWNILYFISFRDSKLYAFERLSLSYGLGMGFVSLEMLIFYFFKLPFSPILVLVPWIVLFILNMVIYFKYGAPGKAENPSLPGKHTALDVFLGCGIALEVIYALFRALIKPMESYDALAMYAIKAKAIFLAGSLPADFFTNTINLFPHPDYPLNIPLCEAFAYLSMGAVNDQLVKIIFPLFFIGTLGLLYFGIRRFAGRTYALLFTFLLATIPQFTAYATNGYLDLVFSYYYFASALFLYMWFKDTNNVSSLVLSAVMVGLAAWTKNEGMMYFVINIALILIFTAAKLKKKENLKSTLLGLAVYTVTSAIILLPWLWIKSCAHLVNNEIAVADLMSLKAFGNYDRIWPIIYEFQKQFLGPKKWNIIWIIFIAVFIIKYKKAFLDGMKYVTLSIIFAFCGYIFIYMITSRNVTWHLSSTASRFFIHFLPVVVFWLACILKEDIDI